MADINKEELSKLFAAYEAADKAWEDQKAEVEKSYRLRSDAVKAIALLVAPTKKLRYKGREITLVVRSNKSSGEDSYFFKGASEKEEKIIEVG